MTLVSYLGPKLNFESFYALHISLLPLTCAVSLPGLFFFCCAFLTAPSTRFFFIINAVFKRGKIFHYGDQLVNHVLSKQVDGVVINVLL